MICTSTYTHMYMAAYTWQLCTRTLLTDARCCLGRARPGRGCLMTSSCSWHTCAVESFSNVEKKSSGMSQNLGGVPCESGSWSAAPIAQQSAVPRLIRRNARRMCFGSTPFPWPNVFCFTYADMIHSAASRASFSMLTSCVSASSTRRCGYLCFNSTCKRSRKVQPTGCNGAAHAGR